jgi:hypothetical protein
MDQRMTQHLYRNFWSKYNGKPGFLSNGWLFIKYTASSLGIVVHACNPSTQEVEAGGS